MRPWISISTERLTPLFDLLKGSSLSSAIILNADHLQALTEVQQAIDKSTLKRFTPSVPLVLYIFPGESLMIALLAQQGEPIQWIHLSVGGTPRVYATMDQLADCITKGRTNSLHLFGQDPSAIIIPYRIQDFAWLQRNNVRVAIALEGFTGDIDCHYGPYKWMNSVGKLPWKFPTLFVPRADPSYHTAFTDGGKIGASAVIFPPHPSNKGSLTPQESLTHEVQGSAQFKELYAVVLALSRVEGPLNLFSDSLYVVNLLPNLIDAHIRLDSNPITPLMIQTRTLLKQRTNPIYVQHLRGHQGLPGFLSQGNSLADRLASTPQCYSVEEATHFHRLTHANWRGLHHRFPLVPVKDLKKIIRTCKSCQPFLQVPPLQGPRCNPRGLRPNHLWQTDITHYPSFGKLKYVFMSADTHSHACWATAHASEKTKHAISHFLQCFATLGLPEQIKTDNGPCFTSQALKDFLTTWNISHSTGIPYNPRGQAIIERQNRTLKDHLQKQKGESLPPHDQLKKALFTLNILNFSKSDGLSAFQRHWATAAPHPAVLVRWKDPLTGQWRGPNPLLTAGRGFGCVFPPSEKKPIWVPARDLKYLPEVKEIVNSDPEGLPPSEEPPLIDS